MRAGRGRSAGDGRMGAAGLVAMEIPSSPGPCERPPQPPQPLLVDPCLPLRDILKALKANVDLTHPLGLPRCEEGHVHGVGHGVGPRRAGIHHARMAHRHATAWSPFLPHHRDPSCKVPCQDQFLEVAKKEPCCVIMMQVGSWCLGWGSPEEALCMRHLSELKRVQWSMCSSAPSLPLALTLLANDPPPKRTKYTHITHFLPPARWGTSTRQWASQHW